ncbi:hypothetical protein [Rhizobium sp. Root1204]|uniref:3'-5' exonuclease n=1 Tax=Rhizobium sp. Root1204 TaxID=1736428 RepID=UPI000B25D698|nr:hypothetical protein [Rhizobium sp. Root1204]
MASDDPTTIKLVRVIDLETAGNGPQDVCEIGWQDVIQGRDGRRELDAERGSLMVNPGRPISPETMAVHHILDREVRTADFQGLLSYTWKAQRALDPIGERPCVAY